MAVNHIQATGTVIGIFNNQADAGRFAGDKSGQGYSQINVVHTSEFQIESGGVTLDLDFDTDIEYIVIAIR